MSLYNLVHGENAAGPALVALLQSIQPFDVGRYRDAWVEVDGDKPVIRVHTRNGGGNRECWCESPEHHCLVDAIESMQAHPWYVKDEDDDFDYTYADFYFAVDLAAIKPDTARAVVALAQPPVDVGARWQAAIDAISVVSGAESEPT